MDPDVVFARPCFPGWCVPSACSLLTHTVCFPSRLHRNVFFSGAPFCFLLRCPICSFLASPLFFPSGRVTNPNDQTKTATHAPPLLPLAVYLQCKLLDQGAQVNALYVPPKKSAVGGASTKATGANKQGASSSKRRVPTIYASRGPHTRDALVLIPSCPSKVRVVSNACRLPFP